MTDQIVPPVLDDEEEPKVTGRQVPMRAITIAALGVAAVIVGAGVWLMTDAGPDMREVAARSAARAPDIVWQRTYGGKRIDAARDIAVLGRNKFAVVARSRSQNAQGDEDIWLLRLNGRGDVKWERAYGGSAQQWVTGIGRMPDGGLVLVGASGKKRAIQAAAWIIRTDSKGKVVWQRRFGGDKADGATGVVVLPDGGIAVSGSISSRGRGDYDGWLIRLDRRGKLIWDRTFGGSEEDTLFAVVATGDGGFALAGSTVSTGAGGGDGWLLKVSATGNQLWSRTFGGEEYDVLNSLARTQDGGFVAAGHTRSQGPPGGGAWLLKLDGSGKMVWQRVLGGPGMSLANKVIALDDGGIVMVGLSRPAENDGREDAWMARYAANGSQQWIKSFAGSGDDNLLAVAPLVDGGFLGAGFTNSSGKGDGDVWILRFGYK